MLEQNVGLDRNLSLLLGGVINLITGRTAEVAPWLASHRDVNAIDLAGAPVRAVTGGR